jgi:hypothetical protein
MRAPTATAVLFVLAIAPMLSARASDHLDSPSTVANPQADIADVYAWTSPNDHRLNLVMTVLGHTFSDKVEYVLHIDSGKRFGHTTASVSVACRFSAAKSVDCNLGDEDSVSGDPTETAGIPGRNHLFQVYAGLRDDPFYNNIKGLLSAYKTAGDAIKSGAQVDVAGCAHFNAATAKSILAQMSHTDGGRAQNLLYNWTVSAIVVSVDLNVVSRGGELLAVWGSTAIGGKQLDRMARPFVANTLLGKEPFAPDDESGLRRQQFNESSSSNAAEFVADLQRSLAFQDALDGQCGNQLLAGPKNAASRYRSLARVFSDDRLWVNSASKVCTRFFAVELANLAGRQRLRADCGGRSPTYDTSNTWRSLLIAGTANTITDGLRADEHPPSAATFPFLAPPDLNGVDH